MLHVSCCTFVLLLGPRGEQIFWILGGRLGLHRNNREIMLTAVSRGWRALKYTPEDQHRAKPSMQGASPPALSTHRPPKLKEYTIDTEITAKRNNMISELITFRITKAKAKV